MKITTKLLHKWVRGELLLLLLLLPAIVVTEMQICCVIYVCVYINILGNGIE